MRLIYTKPILKDLSQGSRIAFVRQFRLMTQDEVSDKLGITGECKRNCIKKGKRIWSTIRVDYNKRRYGIIFRGCN